VPDEVATTVLDRFTEVRLIDDAAYAQTLVRSRHAERGLSRRALADVLRRRGIDEPTAAQALQQVGDDEEVAAARRLVERRLAATRGLDAATRTRRTLAALGRRGYPPGLVGRLVREALAAEGLPEDGTVPDDTWEAPPSDE
jgi:regulatory protein